MKKYLNYLSLFAVLSIGQAFAIDANTNAWGPITTNVQMTISLKEAGKGIEVSQPVKLVIRFENISTNMTFFVGRANATEEDTSYSWSVISPSGKDISPKPRVGFGSGGIIPLAPSQVVELEFNLSHLCMFDEVGTYKVVAKKSLWSPTSNKLFTVVSNPLYVKVIPPIGHKGVKLFQLLQSSKATNSQDGKR